MSHCADSLTGFLKSVKKRYIIIFEVIVLMLIAMAFMIKKQGAPESLDTGVTVTDFSSDHISYNGGWHITPGENEEEKDHIEMLYGPFLKLPKGDYSLVIAYKCDSKQNARPYASGSNIEYIKANTFHLYPDLQTVTYDFRITEPIDNFEVRVYYNGKGDLDVYDIRLFSNLNALKRVFFSLLLFFLLADLCYFNYQKIRQNKKELSYLLLTVLLLSLPLFIHGVGYGLDTDFHLMRIEGISNELRRGVFPVRIQPDWLFGNGYPASIYYGDILLYLPAAMRLMGFNVTQAYKFYIFFVNILTVFLSWFSFRTIVKDKAIAVLMTLAYGTNVYRIMTMVFRDALGEYTAAAFMPVVAAAMYLIYTDEETTKRPDIKNATLLALAMSGIVLSHTLSTEMITVVLIIFALINIRKTIRIRTLLTLVTAMTETALLVLYHLVPFMDYYINMDVGATHGVKDKVLQIQRSGASILDLFLFYRNPFGNRWSLTPGAVLMTALIMAVIFSLATKASRRMTVMTAMSVTVLFIASNLFPWNWLAYHSKIWNALSVVEFPNRYITISAVLLTVLMGMLLEVFWDKGSKRFRLNAASMIILLAVSQTLVMWHYFEEDIVTYYPIDSADVRSDVLLGGDFSRVDKNGEPIEHIRKKPEAIDAPLEMISHEGSTMRLKVRTGNKPGVIKTPFFNYKGYSARDTRGRVFHISDDEYCKVSFAVPANYDGDITVFFKEPWYWKAANIISLVSWIGLAVSYVYFRASSKKAHSE